MAAAMNGIALHGGVRPYGGTFLIFSDYSKPAIRLGALMGAPVVHVFTHDSVGLGEDGPTHQPVEQLAGLRAIPGLRVVRPADANETAAAWKLALESTDHPTALALSRQALPTMAETKGKAADGVARGAYVVSDADGDPEVILVAAGSEVGLAMQAKETLGAGVRVVSMPCDRLFWEQDEGYRESVLPRSVRARVAVEAASPYGWARVAGLDGEVIAIDRFGTSAPGTEALGDLGLTVEAVVEAARRVTSA